MGTYIHGVFQAYDPAAKRWVDVPSEYEQHRHYQLFAVLAGVRNGYGFAGVKTGEPVVPIAEPRGLPADFAVDGDEHPIETLAHMDPRRRQWHEAGEKLAVWMGDHTHSWLEADEMLRWAETAPTVLKVGVMARADYEAWDKSSSPPKSSGDVWGRDVVKIDDNAVARESTPGWTHIRVEWEVSLGYELAYFFDEVKRLAAEHGRVRFVFGFDS